MLDSEEALAAEDPIPPEAEVIVDDGATTTAKLAVTLDFGPLQDDLGYEAYSDIDEMKISNDPSMAGATWQAFAQDVPWTMDANPGELAQVYVLFKDTADNESVGPAIGAILYDPELVYLPLVLRNY